MENRDNNIETDTDEKEISISKKGKKIMGLVIGALIGGLLGFLYHKFVGCSSGACPITANPYISTIYGAIMGMLVQGFH